MSCIIVYTIVVNAMCNDELILCKECNTWVDDVETSVEKHLDEFKPGVNAKRWKNNKNNNNQQKCLYQFSL